MLIMLGSVFQIIRYLLSFFFWYLCCGVHCTHSVFLSVSSSSLFQVCFVNQDGIESLQPSPLFKIKLPRNLKGKAHALPGSEKFTIASADAVGMPEVHSERDKLIVEAYIPPDPGPYPQDQPKRNSVRFTPTQVLITSYMIYGSNFFIFSDVILIVLFFWVQFFFFNSTKV